MNEKRIMQIYSVSWDKYGWIFTVRSMYLFHIVPIYLMPRAERLFCLVKVWDRPSKCDRVFVTNGVTCLGYLQLQRISAMHSKGVLELYSLIGFVCFDGWLVDSQDIIFVLCTHLALTSGASWSPYLSLRQALLIELNSSIEKPHWVS